MSRKPAWMAISVVLMTSALSPQATLAEPPPARVSGGSLLDPECGAREAQPESEVEVAVEANPADRRNLIAVWQQDRYSEGGGARGIGVAASFDGGRTWTPAALPVTKCAGGEYDLGTDPWVAFASDGSRAYVSVYAAKDAEPAIEEMIVLTSVDGGRSWSGPVTVFAGRGLDKETITADPTDPQTAYMAFDHINWDSCAVPEDLVCGATGATLFSRTDDGGATWSPAQAVNVAAPFEIFVAPEIAAVSGKGGTVLVDVYSQAEYYDDTDNATRCFGLEDGYCGHVTIRSQRSVDGGKTWSLPTTIVSSQPRAVADPEGRHQTIRPSWSHVPSVATSSDGRIYVAWMNNDFAVQPVDGREAEIVLAKSADGGITWTSRPVVPLQAAAFVATVAVDDAGRVGLTWYDLGSDRPGDETLDTTVWFASSRDGGATWRRAQIAGPFDMRTAPVGGNIVSGSLFLGDYEGLTVGHKGFVAAFAQAKPAATVGPSDVFAVRAL